MVLFGERKQKPWPSGKETWREGPKGGHLAVIATCDRSGNKDFKVATRGRVSKGDIQKAIGNKIQGAEMLCSDAHRSYTAFAKAIGAEHKNSMPQRDKEPWIGYIMFRM